MTSHVIAASQDKHAELAGQIIDAEKTIIDLKNKLMHIEQAIKIFDENFDLRTIKPKRVLKKSPWFAHNELPRMIFDILHDKKQISITDIVEHILVKKSIDQSNQDAIERISDSIRHMKNNKKIIIENDVISLPISVKNS